MLVDLEELRKKQNTIEDVSFRDAMFGDVEKVFKALISGKIKIDVRHHKSGDSLLMKAVVNRHIVLATALLEAGVNVNIQNNSNKSALLLASAFANNSMIELLLSYGADPYLADDDNSTAVSLAQDSDNLQAFNLASSQDRRVEGNVVYAFLENKKEVISSDYDRNRKTELPAPTAAKVLKFSARG